ncbi:hypothetical protein MAPG_05375 [Magnaporthiopsis poae ATCC 64411]|uniref:Uncharacterized protein n=1 Tax=Magnaporthiopsis poae (strain ATCC 64411 / 73-15) TaxID=644358 RepID=A0A0C4DZ83_MAGP6|nr:hypothetical protein MAPG_05375 [Magnaporthiopsis poae ATCC 64411]
METDDKRRSSFCSNFAHRNEQLGFSLPLWGNKGTEERKEAIMHCPHDGRVPTGSGSPACILFPWKGTWLVVDPGVQFSTEAPSRWLNNHPKPFPRGSGLPHAQAHTPPPFCHAES